jgi:flagellar biosynthesis protein
VPDTRTPADRPTVAVALSYKHGEDPAPRVVASGRGPVAERILELAKGHGIAIRENADVAEMLAALELGDAIPAAAFTVVAEILFYILRANGQLPPAAERAP